MERGSCQQGTAQVNGWFWRQSAFAYQLSHVLSQWQKAPPERFNAISYRPLTISPGLGENRTALNKGSKGTMAAKDSP